MKPVLAVRRKQFFFHKKQNWLKNWAQVQFSCTHCLWPFGIMGLPVIHAYLFQATFIKKRRRVASTLKNPVRISARLHTRHRNLCDTVPQFIQVIRRTLLYKNVCQALNVVYIHKGFMHVKKPCTKCEKIVFEGNPVHKVSDKKWNLVWFITRAHS